MTAAPPTAELAELARALFEAERDRRPITPLSDGRQWLGASEAYAIQQEVVRRRLEAGEQIVGWKVGLTSEAMQQQLGVDQPDYGPMLSSFVVANGGTIPRGELIAPRVEAEIAFRLKAPLRGPGISRDDVLRATEAVMPALEIIDSRIEGWRIRLVDTVADLASSARVVVGDPVRSFDALDLRAVAVALDRNGETVGRGLGSAALGDPAEAVAWAANTLGALGASMEPGHVVMPGALHASVPANAGDRFQAIFDGLGDVTVRFV